MKQLQQPTKPARETASGVRQLPTQQRPQDSVLTTHSLGYETTKALPEERMSSRQTRNSILERTLWFNALH
jgi:hypothetical protein